MAIVLVTLAVIAVGYFFLVRTAGRSIRREKHSMQTDDHYGTARVVSAGYPISCPAINSRLSYPVARRPRTRRQEPNTKVVGKSQTVARAGTPARSPLVTTTACSCIVFALILIPSLLIWFVPGICFTSNARDKAFRSVVAVSSNGRLRGTGAIVGKTENGFLVLTAEHLGLTPDLITVQVYPFEDNSALIKQARVIARDGHRDLTLLQVTAPHVIDEQQLSVARFSNVSWSPFPAPLLATGFPGARLGHVACTSRSRHQMNRTGFKPLTVWKIAASTRREFGGLSGGPVFNLSGDQVAVVIAASRKGLTCIPAAEVGTFLHHNSAYQEARRP